MIRGGRVELPVRDVERAVRFYIETLGMKLVEEAGEALAVIDAGEGFRIALVKRATANAGGGGIGLEPKIPLAEALAILENRGVTFEVKREGGTNVAYFSDPDGHRLHLYQGR